MWRTPLWYFARRVLFRHFHPPQQRVNAHFRDVELVEHLGSGIPRILQSYPKDVFKFMDNTLRVIFPIEEDLQALMEEETQTTTQDTAQDTAQVIKLLKVLNKPYHRGKKYSDYWLLSHREYFQKKLSCPCYNTRLCSTYHPDKPTSKHQKYYLTDKGKELLESLKTIIENFEFSNCEGNTLIKVAVYDGGKQQFFESFEKDNFQQQFLARVPLQGCTHAIIATVVAEAEERFSFLSSLVSHCVMMSALTPVPFTNRYATPHSLGIDRIALVAGAVSSFPQHNTLIIDAGTCLTFDFVIKK